MARLTEFHRQQLLTVAYHRQMNRDPSLDRLAFQITRTTISPNYLGEELETLDREVLIVSADVPPQDGEIDEQHQERENANAVRAVRRQQELIAAGQQPGQQLVNTGQVNDNVGQQAPVAPAAPQQQRQDNQPRANRLCA
jgi:Mn-containing catalase